MVVSQKGNTEEENNGNIVFKNIFTDQLGKRVVVRVGSFTPYTPNPFLKETSGQIFKDDVNVFPPPCCYLMSFRFITKAHWVKICTDLCYTF
jgi:hypothetical protein